MDLPLVPPEQLRLPGAVRPLRKEGPGVGFNRTGGRVRTAAVIWACVCVSTVVWVLLDSYLHERRQRTATPQEVKAAMDAIVVHDALSPAEMDQLDFLADMEDFREEAGDVEYLAAFHHWVQIHSDAHQRDESELQRLRDEWEQAA